MVRKSEREEATHRIELSGFDFHAAGGDTGGKIDLVDGGIARFGLDRHVGEAVFGIRTVAERNNVGGRPETETNLPLLALNTPSWLARSWFESLS